MSDRVAVPKNGRRPQATEPEATPTAPKAPPAETGAVSVGFSPPQLAVGAAVIAAILLIGLRRLRRRR